MGWVQLFEAHHSNEQLCHQQPEGAAGGGPLPRNLGDLHRVLKSLQKGQWHGMGGGGKKVKSLSHVRLFATPWTIAYQAPPSMGFSWQEYWSGLPLLSPENLPDPGIEPGSPALQADSLLSEPAGKPQLRQGTGK